MLATSNTEHPSTDDDVCVGYRVDGDRPTYILIFQDAGGHEPKGVPDRWHLNRLVA